MLHRRRFLTTASRSLALGGAAALTLAGHAAWAQPSYTVPLSQLQEMTATKFPRSVPVQGLFDLTLQAPRLRLLPEVNRIGATMAVDAAGAALRRSHAGTFDVEFALRYEASDRTLRATRSSWANWISPRSSRRSTNCSTPTARCWPSSLWAKSRCTSCARKTPLCSTAWACSRGPSR